jgi:RNA polymerase sigma factor (sigma-70 family)
MGTSQGLVGSERTLAVHEVHQTALRIARRNTDPGIRQMAEDIAQDVSLAFSRDGRWVEVDNPAAWATLATKRRIMNIIRDRDRAMALDPADRLVTAIIDSDPNVSPSLVVGARMHAAQLLALLSPRERELLDLVARGYSHAEIAQRMGYGSARSVTTMLSRVRGKVLEGIGGTSHIHEWVGLASSLMQSPDAVTGREV